MSMTTNPAHARLLADALQAITELQTECSTQRFDALCAELRSATTHDGPSARLTEDTVAWLACGDRCAASETIFTHLTGVDALRGTPASHPTDASAFGRCRKLLEACPQVAAIFPGMRFVSPTWRTLVAEWEDLCCLMDQEAPNWREHRGKAPETFARLRSIGQGFFGDSQ